MIEWTDLITGDRWRLSQDRYQHMLQAWTAKLTGRLPETISTGDGVAALCDYLVRAEQPAPETGEHTPFPILLATGEVNEYTEALPPCPHAPGSYITDHSLQTSAIAFSLAWERHPGDRALLDRVRLTALIHDWPVERRATLLDKVGLATDATLTGWLAMLDAQRDVLEAMLAQREPDGLAYFGERCPPPDDETALILWAAHLAASEPLYTRWEETTEGQGRRFIERREEFVRHPLHQVGERLGDPHIGLVLGGATKIKEYVFESSRLPEMRGASSLLDRLNRADIPALFGAQSREVSPGPALLHAPECVIYANGGDVLALVQTSKAQEIADAIEQMYTDRTLIAQSVAAAGTFSLLELQYGLRPTEFWQETFLATWQDEELRPLLAGYYGRADDEQAAVDRFLRHKGFGELATHLSLKRYWRREGNQGRWNGSGPNLEPRPLVRFETIPFGERCHSCDRRIATESVRVGDEQRHLCKPCEIKHRAGVQEKGRNSIQS